MLQVKQAMPEVLLVPGLEMSQNAQHLSWTAEEVVKSLKTLW